MQFTMTHHWFSSTILIFIDIFSIVDTVETTNQWGSQSVFSGYTPS